jgi:hypothetical protein
VVRDTNQGKGANEPPGWLIVRPAVGVNNSFNTSLFGIRLDKGRWGTLFQLVAAGGDSRGGGSEKICMPARGLCRLSGRLPQCFHIVFVFLNEWFSSACWFPCLALGMHLPSVAAVEVAAVVAAAVVVARCAHSVGAAAEAEEVRAGRLVAVVAAV